MSVTAEELLIKISADVTGATTGINLVNDSMTALGETLGVSTIAAAGMTAGVLALAAGLTESIKMTSDYQTQLSQAQANTTMTTDQINTMSAAILNMSQQSGASLADLGAGYVHISNIMGDAADATHILDVAQQSAVSTGGNVAAYAQTLARVLHEFGMSGDEAAAAMNMLHTASAASDLTLEQFTANSGNALAMAANYSVPLDQVSAAYASLTLHGMDAAMANTQISDQFLRLTTVTPKVATELQRVTQLTGVDLVGDFTAAGLASKGLTGIYADLRDAYTAMGLSTAEATKESMLLGDALRGGRGLAIEVGNGYTDYISKLKQVDDTTASATKLQDDYSRALGTTTQQWDILKAHIGSGIQEAAGPATSAAGGIIGTVNTIWEGIGTTLATIGAGWTNASKDSGDFFAEFADGAKAYVAQINGMNAASDSFHAPGKGPLDAPAAAVELDALSALADAQQQAVADSAAANATAMAATYTAAIATVTDEQKGITSNIKDEQQAIKDTTASYTAQLSPLEAKLKLENDSYTLNSGNLKQSIADVTKKYEDQLAPLQHQQEQLKLNLEITSGPLNAAADAIKLQYDGQIAPLQAQLDTMKAQYDTASGPLKTSVESITAEYNRQIEPVQTTLDHLKQQYDLTSGPLKLSVEAITAEYNKQIEPLQTQLDTLKLQNDLAVGPLQISIANITAAYQQQIDPTQTILDHLNEQYTLASGPLKESIAQITQSFADQIAPQQRTLDLLNQQYTIQSEPILRSIEDVTEQYKNQLTPLQDQLLALQQANDLTNKQVDLQNQITDARLKQSLLVDEGDPTQRAKIAAQLELNKMQEDQLALVQQETTLKTQLAASGLSVANRQDLQLQLQDTQLKLQLAAMVNQPATADVVQQQALLAVQQQSAALTRTQSDAQQQLSEIPLEQQIRQVTDAQKEALKPLQDQLEVLKEQHDYSAFDLQTAITNLKNAEYDRLKPLQDQLANLTLQHDLAIGPLSRAILTVQQAEKDRLAPMLEQLKTLQLQYNTAVGPLNLSIEGLKAAEAARLRPMQDQLTQLQLQYNLATGPLTLAIESLKGKEADRLRPIQDQLTNLQLQYNLATGPLITALTNLQNAEKARLTPIQEQLATLQLQYDIAITKIQPQIDVLTQKEKDRLKPIQDQLKALTDQHTVITTQIQGDIDVVKQHEIDALKPLQDQLQTYQDMSTKLGDLIQGWKDLASAEDQAGAAAGRAATAAGSFHAPGKGPLGGPHVYTAGEFPTSGPAHDAFTGVYGSDAASQWAIQATANGSGSGAGVIDASLSSTDVVQRTDSFLGSYAFGSGANTMCEAFVEQMEGRTDRQGTAYDAAVTRQSEGLMRFDMPPPAGAEVYLGRE